MSREIKTKAERLAHDPRLSDYDFWRSIKNIDYEIFLISQRRQPIPIEMIRWRAILCQARKRRGPG